MNPMRIGFLASQGGSNLQALVDACVDGTIKAEAAVVISNNSGSRALQRAVAAGIPAKHLSSATHPDPVALDRAILTTFRQHGVDMIALAGYMKRIGPAVIGAYRDRILNVHPALLPRHGGEGLYGHRVHEAVLKAGDLESGVTIHLVDELYDHGATVAQARVPVLPDDTVETLAARVLENEHMLYVATLARVASDFATHDHTSSQWTIPIASEVGDTQ